MKTVFVTGPDGLLGSNVIRELVSRNFSVVAMAQKGREPKTIKDLPIKIVEGDITVKQNLIDLSKGCDYFIHTAAVTDLWPTRSAHYYKINLEGTKNAVDAAAINKVQRFVHVGSASTFAPGSLQRPGNENTSSRKPPYPHDYIESKRIAHEHVLDAVKTRNLPAVVVCPTFMIGPFDSKPGPGQFVLAVAKKKMPFVSKGGKNWVAAKDVATAMVNALERGKPGESYILGGHNLSYRDAVKLIAQALEQSKYPKLEIPDMLILLAGMADSLRSRLLNIPPKVSFSMSRLACNKLYYSSEKAIRELGLPVSPLETSIKDLKTWFEENGYL
ncbi:MAG: NAD-dependent epimerase/dehydratase family protein [bacterium]|nr:NAD-dependent epimerase/dehydratase family protein [bacterium]